LGARIEGIGSSRLVIEGAPRLVPASRPYAIIPDRIETGTYLCAAAVTGGDVTVTDTDPALLGAVLEALGQMGCTVLTGPDWIRLSRASELRPLELHTAPYPGFPTDMQAQLMTLATFARGTST